MIGKKPKRILLQGATGSIGRSTLDIIDRHKNDFRVQGLAANSNEPGLLHAAERFRPESIAIQSVDSSNEFKKVAARLGVRKIFIGTDALRDQIQDADIDLLVNAVTGGAGIEPTAAALQKGIPAAVANKETLVAAGPLIMKLAEENGTHVLPIDSEHSAVFQCLLGESPAAVQSIWLTTSGGPFFGKRPQELKHVTVEQALNHPTWSMGSKVTIDSATLFNKGLEVIEAERLFVLPPERIRVVAHRQSIIHSMVEFADGSIKAQLSNPDMRLPILFALSYPERIASDAIKTSVADLGSLTLEPVPLENYPCLKLAYDALATGGTAPAAISAADEVAVEAFLSGKIGFNDIAFILQTVYRNCPHYPLDGFDVVLEADRQARLMAKEIIEEAASKREKAAC